MPRIQASRDAMLQFFYRVWFNGSTGSVPAGESFGQSENTDGTSTIPEQHFEVIGNIINNPQANINAGERNLDAYFSCPAAASSIYIGCGLLLL